MNPAARHFGGLGRTLPELAGAWLAGETGVPPWPQLAGDLCALTHLGRVAIDLACRLWRLGSDDEILVPAYNCGSEIDPYLRHGCRPVLYRVDRAGNIDADDIRRRATRHTRLLHVTHYFGWPQGLQGLRAWCQERQVLLLEDCALALFSADSDGHAVGLLGNGAAFSLTKTLSVPDGGALVLRELPDTWPMALRRPPASHVLRRVLPLLKARALARAEHLGVFSLAQRLLPRSRRPSAQENPSVLPDMPDSYYFAENLATRSISRVSRGLLRKVDPAAVVAQRRENYRVLREGLADCPGIEFLFADLPAGVCPLVLPILVEGRDRWIRELAARAIPAIPWWSGYHRGLDFEPFPEARHLKDHLVALPVHQGLNTDHMKAMSTMLRVVAAQPKAGRTR